MASKLLPIDEPTDEAFDTEEQDVVEDADDEDSEPTDVIIALLSRLILPLLLQMLL